MICPKVQPRARRTSVNRRVVLLGLVGHAMAPTLPSVAQTPMPPINVLGGNDVAINGYDPVAYFVEGAPQQGDPNLALRLRGALWLFSNRANRLRFEQSPEKFIPAYGGYCAYGVAQEFLSGIDPAIWVIVEDRLYLNCTDAVHDLWLQDIVGNNRKADVNWRRLTSPAMRPTP